MKMEAQIALRVKVPFDFKVDSQEPNLEEVDGRTRLVDPVGHEHQAAKITEQRVSAARHAEKELVDKLTNALPRGTKFVEAVVEEVSEV